MLTAAQQGILVISVLGKLPTLGDYLNPNLKHVVDGCCPSCCPQCGVVQELDRSDTLDEVITWAPNDMWSSLLWWRNGRVDRTWLYSVWDCEARPRCGETEEYVENHTLDFVAERLARQIRITVPESYARIQNWLSYEDQFYSRDVIRTPA